MNPNVGDKVRLVHTGGDEAIVTVQVVIQESGTDIGIETETHDFWFGEGWTVVGILPKPHPPQGTLIEGVDYFGDTFRGVALADGVVGAYETESGTWIRIYYDWGSIKSWSSVKKVDSE